MFDNVFFKFLFDEYWGRCGNVYLILLIVCIGFVRVSFIVNYMLVIVVVCWFLVFSVFCCKWCSLGIEKFILWLEFLKLFIVLV